MKLKYLVIVLLSLFVFSCGERKIESGEIEYEINYPYNEISNLMAMMLPKKMTVVFKDTKMMATIKKGKIFSTKIITDEIRKTIEMRLDFGSDVLNTHLTSSDITEMIASQPIYKYSKPQPGDSLVGCSTQQYNLDCKSDSLDGFISVFTTDFSTQNSGWFTSYNGIKGMPLIYMIDRYGIVMQVTATKFTPREVLDSEFDATEIFEAVSYKKYDHKVQELFDVMMN
jgi:hypothetical protein